MRAVFSLCSSCSGNQRMSPKTLRPSQTLRPRGQGKRRDPWTLWPGARRGPAGAACHWAPGLLA